jgi:NAD(P)H dehydrogenase (quinone)
MEILLMNILVLYHSNTGNTEQMARLVAEGASKISGSVVRLKTVADASAEDVIWCEGIALGSPTNLGLLSWEMKKFWDVTFWRY